VRARLTVHPRGQVRGEVIMDKTGLIIEEGGVFEGTIEMSSERKRELKEVRGSSVGES